MRFADLCSKVSKPYLLWLHKNAPNPHKNAPNRATIVVISSDMIFRRDITTHYAKLFPSDSKVTLSTDPARIGGNYGNTVVLLTEEQMREREPIGWYAWDDADLYIVQIEEGHSLQRLRPDLKRGLYFLSPNLRIPQFCHHFISQVDCYRSKPNLVRFNIPLSARKETFWN